MHHKKIALAPMSIIVDHEKKMVQSYSYNYLFRRRDGMFFRWGETFDDNPPFSPYGPELLDIEISTGNCSMSCKFCSKGNTKEPGENMPFGLFRKIIDKMPKSLTQIALGITDITANPDLFYMMAYCREQGIIPNLTITGIDLTQELAVKLAEYVGAVAVSAYQVDKNICYNAVKMLCQVGITQVNIHLIVCEETLDFVYEVLTDIQTDLRLKGLNAVVFLSLKPKGRGAKYHPLSSNTFVELFQYCLQRNLRIGFDSCSAPKFELALKQSNISPKSRQWLRMLSESCEACLFSLYVDVHGRGWPCSFAEEQEGVTPIDVIRAKDFSDVWYALSITDFRQRLLATADNGIRSCPIFEI